MVADPQPPSVLEEEDALALIRLRIEEKRLFEARFLCRKLAASLTPVRKDALEQELGDALAQVEQLRLQAKVLIAQGEHGQAGDLFARIEAIAVDVPGVADEKKTLAGAEALTARLRKPADESVPPAAPIATQPVMAVEEQPPAADTARSMHNSSSRRFSRRFWFLAGVGVLIAGVLLVVFFRMGTLSDDGPPQAHPTPNSIHIQPLEPPSALEASPPQPTPPPPSQPAQQEEPAQPTPTLRLGSLKVE